VKFCVLAVLFSAVAWARTPDVRTGTFRGKLVTYEVVDGWAVYQGDIVLGPADELEATGEKSAGHEASVIPAERYRWPEGTIPYTIDSDMPNPQRVRDAIEEWNSRTPIRLVARSGERNYVRFFRSTARNGVCSSSVGMLGRGEQRITLEDGCGTGSIVHEIGHSVGLWHEQERRDRNRAVSLLYENIDKQYVFNFEQRLSDGEDVGPYNYASIMHYGPVSFSKNGLPTIETVPPGIPIGQRSDLSAADIDAVRRMYGHASSGVTIDTFPSGMVIRVDGGTYNAPQTFDWAAGSQHIIGVVPAQGGTNTRFVFGRWSDDGALEHTITVSADSSVYTANFVRQYRFTLQNSAGGSIQVSPQPEDGYYADRTFVEARPVPNSGFAFGEWLGSQSGSANPKTIYIRGTNNLWAGFAPGILYTITSDPPGRTVTVDGRTYTTPQTFPWQPGSSHVVEASTSPAGDSVRYVFAGWSDGGERQHAVRMPNESAVLTARFTPQYRLAITASPLRGGDVTANPESADGFYDAGTAVHLQAVANAGYALGGWTGDAAGLSNPQTVLMSEQRLVTALFVPPDRIPSLATVSAASFLPGPVAPGQVVTLFGSDIGPASMVRGRFTAGRLDTTLDETRVVFDGFPAPLIYASQNQISAIVPYGISGRAVTRVQVETRGRRTTPEPIDVAPSAPALFTLNSSGTGQAAVLNQDYSLNSADNAAPRGSIIILYATGEGVSDPALADGALVSGMLPRPRLPVQVRIGGRPAIVHYAGAAPGMVAGVLQVNAQVPEGLTVGPAVPISLVIGDAASPPRVTVAVR
jgi:astacin